MEVKGMLAVNLELQAGFPIVWSWMARSQTGRRMDLPEEHRQGDQSSPPCVADLLRLGHHPAPGELHDQAEARTRDCSTSARLENFLLQAWGFARFRASAAHCPHPCRVEGSEVRASKDMKRKSEIAVES